MRANAFETFFLGEIYLSSCDESSGTDHAVPFPWDGSTFFFFGSRKHDINCCYKQPRQQIPTRTLCECVVSTHPELGHSKGIRVAFVLVSSVALADQPNRSGGLGCNAFDGVV